jgi:hypothetical protein
MDHTAIERPPIEHNATQAGIHMAKVIMEEYRHTRQAILEMRPEDDKTFYRPLIWGQEETPQLLANMPSFIYVEPPEEGEMPDIFGNRYLWVLSEKAKELIENVEPSVHTFIPINLKVRGGDRHVGSYYILRCGNIIDAVVIEETEFLEGRGRAAFEKRHTLSPGGGAVLERSKIEGKHLWRGGMARGHETREETPPFLFDWFCSDTLAERIRSEELDYWDFVTCVVR